MPETIVVNAARLSQLGSAEDCVFCLVTNPEMLDSISLIREAPYKDYVTVPFGEGDRFEDILQEKVPEPAHVLVISPYHFFQSPPSEILGPRRKLMGMACNSTPTDPQIIQHFLGVMERTSAEEQAIFSDEFFEKLDSADFLEYVDEKHGARATLDHAREDLVWNQQAGPLEWGEQQIVPSGEISVLPTNIVEFDENLSLPLEGTVAIRGYPILHNGTPSFTRNDQDRIYRRLRSLDQHAVMTQVEKGRITSVRPHDSEAAPVVEMLEAMFEVDSRYQLIWEMGHALNTSLDLLPGNHAMNEVYGATHGCLHLGLGLTPYTQYHLDIISPDITVYTDGGDVVLGTRGGSTVDRIAQMSAS